MAESYETGLVLSGGAARGMANLGVVKAFYEKGIRPDCISGTSVGSIVGAFLATMNFMIFILFLPAISIN